MAKAKTATSVNSTSVKSTKDISIEIATLINEAVEAGNTIMFVNAKTPIDKYTGKPRSLFTLSPSNFSQYGIQVVPVVNPDVVKLG